MNYFILLLSPFIWLNISVLLNQSQFKLEEKESFEHIIYLDKHLKPTEQANAYAIDNFQEKKCQREGVHTIKRINDDFTLLSGQYKKGEQVGVWNYFYTNEEPKQILDYTTDDLTETNYYQNGQLKSVWSVENDSIRALQTAYLPTGEQVVGNGTGLFTSYDEKGENINFKGEFKNGKREGSFVFYGEENDSLVVDVTGLNEYEVKRTYGAMAEYHGGVVELRKELARSFSPKVVAIAGFSCATIQTHFTVEVDGSISTIYTSTNYGEIDKEAIRAVKQLSKQFKPATKFGKPVVLKYSLPFKIEVRS